MFCRDDIAMMYVVRTYIYLHTHMAGLGYYKIVLNIVIPCRTHVQMEKLYPKCIRNGKTYFYGCVMSAFTRQMKSNLNSEENHIDFT